MLRSQEGERLYPKDRDRRGGALETHEVKAEQRRAERRKASRASVCVCVCVAGGGGRGRRGQKPLHEDKLADTQDKTTVLTSLKSNGRLW